MHFLPIFVFIHQFLIYTVSLSSPHPNLNTYQLMQSYNLNNITMIWTTHYSYRSANESKYKFNAHRLVNALFICFLKMTYNQTYLWIWTIAINMTMIWTTHCSYRSANESKYKFYAHRLVHALFIWILNMKYTQT